MPPAIPIATYRLQLTANFDFDAAASVVPYLKALGITHLYASPFMRARKGSAHGYDVIDHARFNPELGGEAGFERLSAVLRQHDLGLILDFVPNHVGVHFADNPWWLDVLEWGPASPHAASFDIDWDILPYRNRGGVLLPIIGTSYGEAHLDSEASYFGPSFMINWLHNNYGGFKAESILINCHYPVSQNSFVLQWGVIVEKPKGLDEQTTDKLARVFTEGVSKGFLQDVEIWKHKTRIDNPLLVEEDGAVYQMRRWYQQFYVDVADVSPDMTDRFEIEVDTTAANEKWQVEVEENLAVQAAQAEQKEATEQAAR